MSEDKSLSLSGEVKKYQGKPTIFVNGKPVYPIIYALTDAPGGLVHCRRSISASVRAARRSPGIKESIEEVMTSVEVENTPAHTPISRYPPRHFLMILEYHVDFKLLLCYDLYTYKNS
jgi:hypothetical protein